MPFRPKNPAKALNLAENLRTKDRCDFCSMNVCRFTGKPTRIYPFCGFKNKFGPLYEKYLNQVKNMVKMDVE